MTEEEKAKDNTKDRKEKNKKIIDVLMDDGEWRKRTKLKKDKKEQKPQTEPESETEPVTESKYEPEPEPQPDPEPQKVDRSDGEDNFGEEPQPEIKAEAVGPEEKMRVPDSERSGAYLSEIERNVLRAIVMGDSSVSDLIRSTNYPEVIVKGAIERLVSKDFIDRNLNPTEKIRGISLKKQGTGFTVGRKRKYRLEFIDVAIIVAIILFVVSLFYYIGLFG